MEENIGLSSDYVINELKVKFSLLVAEMSMPAIVITHRKYLGLLSLRYTHRNTRLVGMFFFFFLKKKRGGIPAIALMSICSFVLLL